MSILWRMETSKFKKAISDYVRITKRDYKETANNKLRDALYWAGNFTKQADASEIKSLASNEAFLKRAAKITGAKYPNRSRHDRISKKTGKVSRKGFSTMQKKVVQTLIKKRLSAITYNKSSFVKAAKLFPQTGKKAPSTKVRMSKGSRASTYLATESKPYAKAVMFWGTETGNGKSVIEKNALAGLRKGFRHVRKDMMTYLRNKLKRAAKASFR